MSQSLTVARNRSHSSLLVVHEDPVHLVGQRALDHRVGPERVQRRAEVAGTFFTSLPPAIAS